MSPLKRVNRVAPSPGVITERGALKFTPDEDTPLKSSSATLLDQKTKLVSAENKDRPDSAPQKREGDRQCQQMPIDARVIIRSGEVEVEGT